jgi:nitric oxide reductase NorE protein
MNALPARPPPDLAEPPGGVLMWLIVGLELLTFAIVFVMIALFRSGEPALFHEGQLALSKPFGLALTLLLVTSGAFAAEAVHAARASHFVRAQRLLIAALGGGALFVLLKLEDYRAHLEAGHALGTNDFWDAYYLATGFHFVHVLVGLGLLTWAARKVTRAAPVETIAAVALFWHLCDLAWFFLFPLFFAGA